MIAPGLILVPKTLRLLKASSLAVVDVRGASSSLLRSHKIYSAESLAALVLSVSCLRTCSAPLYYCYLSRLCRKLLVVLVLMWILTESRILVLLVSLYRLLAPCSCCPVMTLRYVRMKFVLYSDSERCMSTRAANHTHWLSTRRGTKRGHATST